jgi:hypothetical protein
MPWKSPESARLHELAQHFRHFAGETQQPNYACMMIRTADALDSQAAKLEGLPNPAGLVETLESARSYT